MDINIRIGINAYIVYKGASLKSVDFMETSKENDQLRWEYRLDSLEECEKGRALDKQLRH